MATPSSQPEKGAAKCPVQLSDVDLFEPGAQEHWFEAYKILHAEAPVCRLPGEGQIPGSDAFIISKYDDIAAIIRDPDTFPFINAAESQAIESQIIQDSGFTDSLKARETLRPTMDTHKQHRQQLTDPWVGASGAERHRDMVVETTNTLMDSWIDEGEVEFVKGFAAPLPQITITKILGFPLEDMPTLRKWEGAQVRRFVWGKGNRNIMSADEEAENAATLLDFHRYIQDRIDDKRRNPGEDMTTFLTTVRYGEEQRLLSDGEITSVIYGMHIGGNETTQYALTAEAMLLAQDPNLFAELKADRSKVRFFVEEALRLYAPTQGLSTRMATKDVEFRGVEVPKGSVLHLRWGAGNRDEENYPNAGELDLTRHAVGRHLTFSQGPRICPGAGLSRLEQNIAVNCWLDRFDRMELTPGKNDLTHQPGIMLGLWALNLSFEPAA